jgi:allantoinase
MVAQVGKAQLLSRPSVLVRDGRIAAVVDADAVPAGTPTEDLGDSVLMPGLVDSHVHVNEPGRTEWEGFETATRAAAAGGVTTLVDMPLNSSPVTTTRDALERKRDAAAGRGLVDCAFWGGLVPGNAQDVGSLLDAGACGVKAFLCHSGIDDFPAAGEAELRGAGFVEQPTKIAVLRATARTIDLIVIRFSFHQAE